MKLDLDFVKEILEELESNDSFLVSYQLERENSTEDKKLGHLFVMDDAKLIDFTHECDESNTYYAIDNLRITYSGYQFLEASRNNSIWQKIKTLTTPVAIEIAKTLAVEGGKAALGIK